MNASPQQSRDERSVVVGHKSPVNEITKRFEGGQRAPAQAVGSVVTTREVEVPPARLARVLKTSGRINFEMPDGAQSFSGVLRAGKVVSDRHYDFEELRRQGVLLGEVQDELIGVPAGGGASSQVQLRDLLGALRDMGLEVVPRTEQGVRAAPSDGDEVARLKARIAELEGGAKGEEKPDAKPRGQR